jgi:gas vesicle protein
MSRATEVLIGCLIGLAVGAFVGFLFVAWV